jgi:MYXO-CTERM domain-containing protein
MPDSAGYNSLSGDVLSLTGIASTGPAVTKSIGGVTYTLNPTDAFAIEMTYSPANMIASYQFGHTMGWNLANIRASGEAQLTYYNVATNAWSKTLIVNNVGAEGAKSQNQNFAGDFAAFVAARTLNPDSNLSAWVGSWGFAYTNADGSGAADGYRMWAILDHNSAFGPTPAPGALALLGMAGILGGTRRRRA